MKMPGQSITSAKINAKAIEYVRCYLLKETKISVNKSVVHIESFQTLKISVKIDLSVKDTELGYFPFSVKLLNISHKAHTIFQEYKEKILFLSQKVKNIAYSCYIL